MSLEYRKLNCPNCGAVVELPGWWMSGTIMCTSCLTQVAIPAPPESPLADHPSPVLAAGPANAAGAPPVADAPAPIPVPPAGDPDGPTPDLSGASPAAPAFVAEYAAAPAGNLSAPPDNTRDSTPGATAEARDDAGPEPLRIPLAMGMQGMVDGITYQITGRVRYRDGDEDWDEWLLVNPQEDVRWLADSERRGLVLWCPVTLDAPIEPSAIVPDAVLSLGSLLVRIRSRALATIVGLEGECAGIADIGDTIGYATGIAASGPYSIEWTATDVESYHGQHLSAAEVARAFGVVSDAAGPPGAPPAPPRDWATPPADLQPSAGFEAGGTQLPRALLIMIVVLVVALCLLTWAGSPR
ncbi:MAG TPA: DUF4178 domain-containing protein [Chloroflexia bacterium]|nr:DUF4178 domain-containing protein [Chloroflexia bacterium]